MDRRRLLQSTVLGAVIVIGPAPAVPATTQVSLLEENAMFNPAHPYEPLTSENSALVLVDHQSAL